MKSYSIVLFLLLFSSIYANDTENSSNQKKEKKKASFAIPFSLGANAQNAKNEGLSPLVYKGIGLNGSLGFYAVSEKFIHQVDIKAIYSALTNKFYDEGNDNIVISLAGDVQYNGYYLVTKIYHDRVNWFLGGGVETFFNLRANSGLGNSSADFDWLTSLNASSLIYYKFLFFGSTFDVGWTLSLPVVNYWMKPNYISVPDFIEKDYQLLDKNSRGITSMHEIQRVESKLEASFFFKNGNKVSLLYNWDYYHFDIGYNPVHNGMHTLAVKLYFTLR